ncbi:MAG: NFACT RNA binding domain-containing protein [Candidatus Woesearchaeota archaeon]|nr:NFACT RNA binding domain-containing protein [Candidatus Woesearchaeota archaeon]
MQITLDSRKSLEKNAEMYFERAKKAKKKALGAHDAVLRLKVQLADLQAKQDIAVAKVVERLQKKAIPPAHKEWFESFHWFVSSDGFLCVGGRDAVSNEVVIKKHTLANDIVFHTEAPGSPFFVIITNGKSVPDATLRETADATAIFSRAWRMGISSVEVYWVKPEQVSKTAKSGEYISRGAFMIVGKRNYFTVSANRLAIGRTQDNKVMSGPVSAIKTHCKTAMLIKHGSQKTSSLAKFIAKKLELQDVNTVIAALPAGGCDVATE